MTAPKAVQDQLKQAEEMQKRMYENQETTTEEATEEVAQEEPKHVEETTEVENEDRATAPEPEEDGHAEPESESIDEKYRKLLAAHQTLQGKYRAEVVRTNEENRALKQQLSKAQQAKAAAEKTAETANAKLSDATDRLKLEIGDDATEALSDFAQTLVQEKLESQRPKQEQDENSDEAANRFWSAIYAEIPDFDAMNANPEWHKWLQGSDSSTGLTYQDTLNQAGDSLNATKVLLLAQQFRHEQKQTRKASQKTLEEHVSPPKKEKRAAVKQTPNYTPKDYEDLQTQIRQGLWKGREAEARELEQQIHAALTG
jgi:hypothetical protein